MHYFVCTCTLYWPVLLHLSFTKNDSQHVKMLARNSLQELYAKIIYFIPITMITIYVL